MNNSPNYTNLKKLINRLDKLGLTADLALDDEDIADMIWLASQMGDVEKSTSTNSQTSLEFKPIEKLPDDKNQDKKNKNKEVINIYPKNPELDTEEKPKKQQLLETTTPKTGFPFPVAAAKAIDNGLEIGRSLRFIKLKVPYRNRFVLDEEATINRIIERNIWSPVTKPEPERWLNLELIVENSKSAFIWQELIDELEQILAKQGAFFNIRTWVIKSENVENANSENLTLIRRYRKGKLSKRKHQHKELIHPNQRGLTLIVSDCVSPLWQNQTWYQWLKDWSKFQPTAILQLFPEDLWDNTQLSLGRKIFARSLKPGVVNHKLIFDDLPFWLSLDKEKNLVLPVFNLETDILKLWSKVVAGFGHARISTYLFDLEYLRENLISLNQENVEETNHKGHKGHEEERVIESSVSSNDEDVKETEKAKKIVKIFLGTASPIAQRLAGMMAALPVDIAVVNLIRKTYFQEAKPVHVAEVYMGGLFADITPANHQGTERVYDFIPGVRKVLNNAMAINETEDILDAISEFIGERIGLSVNNFTALIAALPKTQTEQEKILPFAHIAVDVFKNIGGEYAEFADAIDKHIQKSTLPEQTEPLKPPEPELKTCDFQVATIEIIKQTTFKFVVATLEKQSKRRFFGLSREETNWVVNREEKQAFGVIEELGEGVNLELMEIPGGTFLMGSPEDEEGRFRYESPQHQVTVPTFFMGKYPITQAQWRIVAGWEQIDKKLNPDPSRFKDEYKGIDRWQRPVENIRWSDAKEFCQRLSKKTGFEYRLPTEAEWEYACRAGTTTPFHFGETITAELANYDGNSVYGDGVKGKYRGQTTPVGYFQVANNFGLYDMHGNVWEWCEDDWHDDYKDAPTNGIAWLDNESSNNKVCRGGSWLYNTMNCRCATRFNLNDTYKGFRVVRVIKI